MRILVLLAAAVWAADAGTLEALLKERSRSVAGTFTVAVPEAELQVSLDGFRLTPAMGLTTRFVFDPRGSAEGELVLLEDEVAGVSRRALDAGFAPAGLRHKFLRESPKVAFLSVRSSGTIEDLTERARLLLEAAREIRAAKKLQAGPTKVEAGLDAALLDRALGARGQAVDGLLRYDGAVFQGKMERAAVAGEAEASDAAALAREGFELTAVDGGRAWFWGVGPAEELARALKRAAPAGGAGRGRGP